ncbi:hypothetical protein LCGC14_2530750, partial [marine sediment metagenome]
LDDPDKPGFWGIRVGGGFVFPFGPFQPLVVAMAKTARAGAAAAQGEKPKTSDLQAWPRFVEGKASIPARFLLRATEALGIPLDAVRGQPFTRPEIIRPNQNLLDFLQEELVPIGPEQAIEGIREGAPITALEIFGGRTTVETPAQELRRKFEEKHNREYDPVTDRVIALDDPEFAPLVRAADERSAERGFESGEARQQREEIAEQQAQLLRPFVEGIRQGNPQAGSAFREQFAQFKTLMAGVTIDSVFGVDFGEDETEVERLRGELGSLNPFSPEFLDAGEDGNFSVDWDAYEAKRDSIIDQIEAQRPGFRQAYESRLRLPEEFADVEGAFLQARQLRDQLDEISPVQGMTAQEYDEIRDFLRDVNAQRMQWRLDPSVGDVPLGQAVGIVGKQQGKDRKFMNAANALRGGIPDRLRNPEYDQFLLANAGTAQDAQGLFLFYPELFRRTSLQLGLGQGQGVPVFDTAGGISIGRGGRRRSRRSRRRR